MVGTTQHEVLVALHPRQVETKQSEPFPHWESVL